MANTENEKYILTVYNTITRRMEAVEVSQEVYQTYRRTGWNIKDNDSSFYNHEIQMSSLIGGEDGSYENFKEFIDTENVPDKTVVKAMQIEALRQAVSNLTEEELELIHDIFFHGLSERECAAKRGLPQKTVNNRKHAIIRKLQKLSDFKK